MGLIENQVATGATAFYPGAPSIDSSETQDAGNSGADEEDPEVDDVCDVFLFRIDR